MTAGESGVTLRNFFAGLAENTFQSQFGVADPPLIDYLSNLLLRFVRTDAVNRLRGPGGRRIESLGEMLSEAEARLGDARREVHRHIGDFTLFWAGLYPETLQSQRGVASLDRFAAYCQQGKRCYYIASTIETDRAAEAPGEVLERLSSQYEMCAYGLREVRREWERRDGDDETPRPLLIN